MSTRSQEKRKATEEAEHKDPLDPKTPRDASEIADMLWEVSDLRRRLADANAKITEQARGYKRRLRERDCEEVTDHVDTAVGKLRAILKELMQLNDEVGAHTQLQDHLPPTTNVGGLDEQLEKLVDFADKVSEQARECREHRWIYK